MKKRRAFILVVVLLLLTTFSAFALGYWADNFDSYAANSQMHGQGGWKGWDNSPGAGALVSTAFANSAPNSVEIIGASDLVHEYTGATSGYLIYTAYQYIPGNATGQTYFILLNTYNDGGPYNWSTQVCFDLAAGTVNDDVSATCSSASPAAIVYDQWVEIRIEIDLDANTQSFYYNGGLLYTDSWTEHVSGSGAVNVAAVDLYANNASAVYYDDMSFGPPQPTDVSLTAFGSDTVVSNSTMAVVVVSLLLVVAAAYVWRRKVQSEL